MWPFRSSTAEPELSPGLRARLDALEEANRQQGKHLKALELDWQEWYDKFRLLFMRLSKRIKDAANAEGNGAESHQDAPHDTIARPPYLGPSRRNY